MTERELLLLGVLKAGRDRTPLLVYHDWLMERPELPAAEATAEFIRVATTPPEGEKPSGNFTRSPVWCVEWLEENWTRLVPSVKAFAVPHRADDGEGLAEVAFGERARVDNALVHAVVGIKGSRGDIYPCGLKITVGFGLLTFFEMKSVWGRKQVAPLLATDQPQLVMNLPPDPPSPYRPPRPRPEPPADTRTLSELLGGL